MIIQPSFKYKHTGMERMPIDVRKKRSQQVAMVDCYFLGFRIKDVGDYRYHHAWIMADDHEQFMYGLSIELDRILDKYPLLSGNDVDLIHVQNLQFRHMNLTDANRASIHNEVQFVIGVRDDKRFAFLGFEPGDGNIVLSDCSTVNAKNAVQLGRHQWMQQIGKPTKVLAVLQAHPVVKEFDVLFSMEAELIESVIAGLRGGAVH